ncbi:MAG: PIN domain-containing protein [Candidatus Diapherotrites archaeon]|nr:PIN domain-containing protein [Candidatus Diapherotrites archaeon]MDZ4256883.1 PIN domain-containing protein [archaeon]
MTGIKYLLDTSTWIEYFLGTPSGEKVQQVLNSGDPCYTCGPVISEVASTLLRNGLECRPPIEFVKSKCVFLEGNIDDFANAGIRHAVLKKEEHRISYTDALLVVFSETRNLKIVSKDVHLKKHNTLFLH